MPEEGHTGPKITSIIEHLAYNDLEWKTNCDLYWQEDYNSWEGCYDKHLSAKGQLFFMASK